MNRFDDASILEPLPQRGGIERVYVKKPACVKPSKTFGITGKRSGDRLACEHEEKHDILSPDAPRREERNCKKMRAEKSDVLKRLNYIEGHLKGIRKMVDEDKYCVDILRQTYAVRKAIEKLEAIILENHLHACVPDAITHGKEREVIDELVQLYTLAGNR
jgi:CsoR family transcriptional regulator, copper-sensing transcriptional repressor